MEPPGEEAVTAALSAAGSGTKFQDEQSKIVASQLQEPRRGQGENAGDGRRHNVHILRSSGHRGEFREE